MNKSEVLEHIKKVLNNTPADWLGLTTHRLDIYKEDKAKTEFLEEFERLLKENRLEEEALSELPTAYDYIRLGHPLSSVLEWAIAEINGLEPNNVISFASETAPILAVLRMNLLSGTKTRIIYQDELPKAFDAEILRKVYGFKFDLELAEGNGAKSAYDGSTLFVSRKSEVAEVNINSHIDFSVNILSGLGSFVVINGANTEAAVSEIQHFRRRETIAMTPADCLSALGRLVGLPSQRGADSNSESNKNAVSDIVQSITGAPTAPLVASSGLSMQYGIMMGLIDAAYENHPGKPIKFIVPPNCYGGTNDQARRVAASVANVEIVDLPVDRENDMVASIERILDEVANEDAIPYIIAEIPTNPRVEVPDLRALKSALRKIRRTSGGNTAVDPVFILDQTFCPNVQFLGEGKVLSESRSISYVSGSKFPSGGQCTAGYCVSNRAAADLMAKIERHLKLCDNEATALQMEILAKQLPSMNSRIADAYTNTREFVDFIEEQLPDAKINFVSRELAEQGFTPSVFSLDLPTKGNTDEEREAYKRALNHRLIEMMITKIPNEGKYCVSYGQLKGSYWTIPATSTQGTTKEGDKDYIVRASLAPNMDMDRHKEVFREFVGIL